MELSFWNPQKTVSLFTIHYRNNLWNGPWLKLSQMESLTSGTLWSLVSCTLVMCREYFMLHYILIRVLFSHPKNLLPPSFHLTMRSTHITLSPPLQSFLKNCKINTTWPEVSKELTYLGLMELTSLNISICIYLSVSWPRVTFICIYLCLSLYCTEAPVIIWSMTYMDK